VVLVFFGNGSPPLLAPVLVLNDGLWRLAATLGARSSFKKLPKRDVMGADIAQLCGLIAEPVEPLALRLSSNLMVGVAR
jgi:meiotic recombination protein REC8